MSGGGFQVVMSDLESMAGVFHRESGTFQAIMPDNGPACPDAGGGDVNTALRAAAQLLGVLHQQMAAVIDQHGEKLQKAHDNYAHTDASLAQVASSLTLSDPV